MSEWNTNSNNKESKFFECEDGENSWETTIGDIISQRSTEDWNVKIWWVLAVYGFWIMDVWSITKINETKLSMAPSILKLWAKVIFDSLFLLIFLVILMALFIVLFVRFIMLWIYMALSPLFWLFYFFGWKNLFWMEAFWDKFNIKEFIKLAFIPVFVSAALSFWLIFLFIIWEWLGKADTTNNKLFSEKWMNLWATNLRITWLTWDQTENAFNTALLWLKEAKNALLYIILKIFWLAFLWVAVMTALGKTKITEKVVSPFTKIGSEVWNIALDLPKLIPMPWTWASIWSAMKAAEMWVLKAKQEMGKKERSLWEKWFSSPGEKEIYKRFDKLETLDWKQYKQAFWDMVKDFWAVNLATNEKFNNAFMKNLEKIVWKEDTERFVQSAYKREYDEMSEILKKANDKDWYIFWDGTLKETIRSYMDWSSAWSQTQTSTTQTQNININIANNNHWINREWLKLDISWNPEKENGKYQVGDLDILVKSLKQALDGRISDKDKLKAELENVFNEDGVTKILRKLEELWWLEYSTN